MLYYKKYLPLFALLLLLNGCTSVAKSQGPIEQMMVGKSRCISSVKQPFVCSFTIRVAENAHSGQQWTYEIVVAKEDVGHIEIQPRASGSLSAGESMQITLIVHQCPFTIKVVDVDTGQQPPLSFFTLSQPGCPSY